MNINKCFSVADPEKYWLNRPSTGTYCRCVVFLTLCKGQEIFSDYQFDFKIQLILFIYFIL